jgi:hypothetical protein
VFQVIRCFRLLGYWVFQVIGFIRFRTIHTAIGFMTVIRYLLVTRIILVITIILVVRVITVHSNHRADSGNYKEYSVYYKSSSLSS